MKSAETRAAESLAVQEATRRAVKGPDTVCENDRVRTGQALKQQTGRVANEARRTT